MTKATNTYDYIIAGMGAAGLSLAMQLKKSTVPFSRILLIDKDLKKNNDRTWCFWTTQHNEWYEEVIFKKWSHFEFKSNTFEKRFELSPYHYQMIRGVDFYAYCLKELSADPRFEIKTENITGLSSEKVQGVLSTPDHTYTAKHIFNSALRNYEVRKRDINYVQHFKGWVIETQKECFDESCPVFMDFRTEQYQDCRFFYLLPFSKTKALIEYTGFSPFTLPSEVYDQKLKAYITQELQIEAYQIEETEYGEIPMMESEFINPYGHKVTNIGTAAGNSKTSTGYTFYFIQKSITQIITQLENNKGLAPLTKSERFKLYDRILLDVIDKNRMPADLLFATLFKKNKLSTLLSFLNEESNLIQELGIVNSVPKVPFTKAGLMKLIKF